MSSLVDDISGADKEEDSLETGMSCYNKKLDQHVIQISKYIPEF